MNVIKWTTEREEELLRRWKGEEKALEYASHESRGKTSWGTKETNKKKQTWGE